MRLTASFPKSTRARLAAAAVVLGLVAAGTTVGIQQFTGLPDDAAFEYSGTVVTKDELAQRVELLGALYGIAKPKDKKGQASFQRDTAKAVAVSMILDHEAKKRDIVVADKSARDTLGTMIDTQLGSDGQSEFTKILGEFGVNEKNVLEEIKRQQATAKLFQEVTAKVIAAVTPADARSYFDANPTKFSAPESRRLSNIVVATRKEANQILAEARSGSEFATLATERSLDESTRAAKGDLGLVAASQLETGYAKAAFATPAGSNYGPVETKFGWNVGRVVAVQPASNATYEQVSAQVLDTLRSERALKFWRTYLGKAIKDADVEYADDYRPADPDAPPSDQPGVPTAVPSDKP